MLPTALVLTGMHMLLGFGWSHAASNGSNVPDGCKLPMQPENGQYRLDGCNPPCQPVPGQTVSTAFISYTCNPGFILSGYAVLLCDSGWSSPFPTCYPATCPVQSDLSRNVSLCTLNEQKVDCDKPMKPGTKVVMKCNEFYTNVESMANFVTTCQSNGRWTPRVPPCIPTCGQLGSYDTLIPGYHYWWHLSNKPESNLDVPWHAGIYREIDGKFEEICGGTIISERIIVAAGYCFWNSNSEKPFDHNEFRVAVGKIHHNWYKEEKTVQLPAIDRIIIHESFRGSISNWRNDIALVKLKDSLVMTKAVRPICLDFGNKYVNLFTPGKFGVIVGWGGTEKEIRRQKLRKITLPYIDFKQCDREVPASFRPFLTEDKFCAGYLNGTSVCPADGGSGFATQFEDGRWYLMGIVSVGVPSRNEDVCNMFTYTTFTKVYMYYDFIQRHFASL